MVNESTIRVSYLDWASLLLVIVGALNWGLVGLGGFINQNLNIVELLLGGVPLLENLVYLLVGLAGLYELYFMYQIYESRTGAPA